MNGVPSDEEFLTALDVLEWEHRKGPGPTIGDLIMHQALGELITELKGRIGESL